MELPTDRLPGLVSLLSTSTKTTSSYPSFTFTIDSLLRLPLRQTQHQHSLHLAFRSLPEHPSPISPPPRLIAAPELLPTALSFLPTRVSLRVSFPALPAPPAGLPPESPPHPAAPFLLATGRRRALPAFPALPRGPRGAWPAPPVALPRDLVAEL